MKPQITGDVQGLPLGSQVVTAVQGRSVSSSPPSPGHALQWSSSTKQWVPSYPTILRYKKNSSLLVVNSIAEADLLNGEITVDANAISPSGVLRLTAWGDSKNNSGAAQHPPRFKFKLGSTTVFDTSAANFADWGNSALRLGWRIEAEVSNLGVATSQWCSITVNFSGAITAGDNAAFTTGEGIYASMANAYIGIGCASSAVDTTAAQALVLSVINPAANASLDVTLKSAVVTIE